MYITKHFQIQCDKCGLIERINMPEYKTLGAAREFWMTAGWAFLYGADYVDGVNACPACVAKTESNSEE